MWMLILELLAVLGLAVFIVAWTMSGRRRTEQDASAALEATDAKADEHQRR